MAKVTIHGDAMVVKSTMKYEDIQKLQKFAPDALVLLQDNTPIFTLSVGKTPIFGNMGVRFCSRTPEGEATLTLPLAPGMTQAEQIGFVREENSPILFNLNTIEALAADEVVALAATIDEVMSNVEVVQ